MSSHKGRLDVLKYLRSIGANMDAVNSVRVMKVVDVFFVFCFDCSMDGIYS